jgi:peptide/nickel transport system substrate-binding protein
MPHGFESRRLKPYYSMFEDGVGGTTRDTGGPMDDITRRRFMLLLGAAGSGLLVACASDGDSADGDTTTTGASSDTTSSPDSTTGETDAATTTAAPEPTGPSGTLRLGSPWPFTTFNPHDALRAGTGGMAYWRVQFDSLVERAEDGELLPGLATSWDLTPEGFTLQLRGGVTFSDGTPFDASVVQANLENVGRDPRLAGIFGGITFEVVSPTELRGTLPRPNPTFINELVSNGGLMVSPATIGTPAIDTDPVGTGPWVYQSGESTPGQVYVFTLREGYWNPEVQGVERVEVYELPDIGARGNALRSNQVDLTAFTDPTQVEIEQAGFTLLSIPSDSQAFLVMDRAGELVPALASADVRRALSLAINRDVLAEQLLNGSAAPLTQMRAEGHPEYDESLEGLVGYDPDEARALLEGAGFGDGFSFSLPFNANWRTTYEAVQSFWAEIGVTVELEPLAPAEFGPRNTSGEFPLAFLPAPGPDFANQCMFFFGPGPVNAFRVPDEDVLPLIGAASTTFGEGRRDTLIDLQRLILEQAYFIPIVAGIKSAAHADNVSGVAWTFDDLVPSPARVRVG